MGGLAIGSGGYYGEERIGANYNDDNIGDYDDDAGYGDGNADVYDDDDAGVAIGDWKWWLLRRGVVPITVVASPTPRPSRHALTSYIVLTLFFSWTKKFKEWIHVLSLFEDAKTTPH